jgi:hypothetical protein
MGVNTCKAVIQAERGNHERMSMLWQANGTLR